MLIMFKPSKFFLIISLFFLFSQALSAQQNNKLGINSFIQLTNSDYNMGKIVSGKPVEYNVSIKNISKDTISLQRVQAGCGCTSPKYAAGQVLKPGDVTMITLGFDGKTVGAFTKFADIYFGNGQSTKIKFSGEAVKQ
jgi:hypothetical protein